eukprot:g6795.t1
MSPSKRITCLEALKHPWFQEQKSSARFDATVLGNLRSFSVANRFQKAAMTAVAYQLTPEERLWLWQEQAELREVFVKLDENSDGYLSFKEIKQGLECQLNEEHIPNLSEILDSMDTNQDGKIEYTEFIAAAMERIGVAGTDSANFYFTQMDTDQNGEVCFQEFMDMLHTDTSGSPKKRPKSVHLEELMTSIDS